MSLINRAMRFARSRQGQQLIDRASRYARGPEGRARMEQVRRQLGARRSGGTRPR